jgi:O-antigen ligase
VFFGYFVGNRGFAQLMPFPGIPILPAELVLVVAGAWLCFQCAWTQRIPFQRDLLNSMILLWLIVGGTRLLFDVRQFGVMAVRDFAMVYYAFFFYLAQHIGREQTARRFLLFTMVIASVVQPLAAMLSTTFSGFFFQVLSVQGVPLILFKGDLAFTFTAVSAFVLAFMVEGRLRWLAFFVATGEVLFVVSGDNRASVLGVLAALSWLAISRARRFVAVQVATLVCACLVVAAFALIFRTSWAERKYSGAAERVQSLTDYFGSGTYVSEESAMKGDNNRFRSMWWRAVVDETIEVSPVFGLGFGYDLARNFLREYNPEIEDFSARSPHSIVVSTLGRMGFTGIGVFLAIIGSITLRTWRAVRHPETSRQTLGLWAAVWTILVSSCFGVVLEGPMGAVVFWTLLGILNAPAATIAESGTTSGWPESAESVREPSALHLPDGIADVQAGGR